jgi:hypothetical protein
MEGSSFTGDFERWMKGAVGVEQLSLRELFEENLEGDFISGGPGGYVEKAVEMGISFHRGWAEEPGRELVYRGH